MKKVRKLASLLLALVMILSLSVPTYAVSSNDENAEGGTITITNATIGQSYHFYLLFNVTYGDTYTVREKDVDVDYIPTTYFATAEQVKALDAYEGNVFNFTPIEAMYTVSYKIGGTTYSGVVTETAYKELAADAENNDITDFAYKLYSEACYQVTKKDALDDGTEVTDAMVTEFVKSFFVVLSGGVTVCYFPGAVEITSSDAVDASDNYYNVVSGISNCVATESKVVIKNLPYGYYFVTSSLGSVISLTTTNPEAAIKDKNSSNPSWDNDTPVPDDPVKSVLDKTVDSETQEATYRDIDGEKVSVGDTLTYQISYTNTATYTDPDGTEYQVKLDEVVVTDEAPKGTTYVNDTITIYFMMNGVLGDYKDAVDVDTVYGYNVNVGSETDYTIDTIESYVDYDPETIYYQCDDISELTWSVKNLLYDVTMVVEFQVEVTEDALLITQPEERTVINDADVEVTLANNKYDLTTNVVRNPVGNEDEPEKDVLDESGVSINYESVKVGDILTYTISYTVLDDDIVVGAETAKLTICDAPPTGTVYVLESAAAVVYDVEAEAVREELTDADTTITVDSGNNITWEIDGLVAGNYVVASFQVEVTEAALTITDSTVINQADVETPTHEYKTNIVSNPVPDDETPVKDVVNDKAESIDGDKVKENDILTYVITYTVPSASANHELGVLTIVDAPPEGTVYVDASAGATVAGVDIDLTKYEDTVSIDDDGNITWTLNDSEKETYPLSGGETVTVSFQVMVTADALEIVDQTVVNEADVTMGDNSYKTNLVENPVYKPGDPVKDVVDSTDTSINKESVKVWDVLTYTIEFTNTTGDKIEELTIEDEPPAGTVYIDGSVDIIKYGDVTPDNFTYIVDESSHHITWTAKYLGEGETVKVSFQVYVTADALTIVDSTVVNQADVTIGDNTYKTNIVRNPVEPPKEFGKVIVNDDGTESTVSTGAFGDTVTFDVSVDAVNYVSTEKDADVVQVAAYYIYDQMDPGLTLDKDSLQLSINGVVYDAQESSTGTGKGGESVTIYTVESPVNSTLFVAENYNGEYTLIEVTIPWVDADDAGVYPNCEIHLIYSATINENAVIAGSGNYNRAIYDYSTVDESTPITPDPTKPTYPSGKELNHGTYEVSTQTFTYALGIQKVDKGTGEPLQNAYFTVVDAGGNTVYAVYHEAEKCYYYTPVSEDDDPDAGTAVAIAEEGEEEEEVEVTDTFITDENGQIVIKGVDVGTYVFTETKAPHGYVRIKTPIYVTAAMSSNSETSETVSYTETRYFEAITADEWDDYAGDVYIKNEDGSFSMVEKPAGEYDKETTYYQAVWSHRTSSTSSSTSQWYTFDLEVTCLIVENTLGNTLASTGGMGTTIFYIVGGILVLGAAIVLITRRRMRNE